MPKLHKTQLLLFFSFFIIFSTFTYCQDITETINYSQRQGADEQCSFSGCTYFGGFGDIISYTNSSVTNSSTKNARYLFEHPNFTNDKIKRIVLEVEISKYGFSTSGSTIMQIRAPQTSCNEDVPWFGGLSFAEQEDLFNCNLFGNIVFQDGIGTTNISPTTHNLLIYDENLSGFSSQTLAYFNPSNDSLTLSFTPIVGDTGIHSAKIHITYEGNSVPDTPSLSATSNSTSSINLNWTNINSSTSYNVFRCDNNQLIATTINNSYTVSGLNSEPAIVIKFRLLIIMVFQTFLIVQAPQLIGLQ
ncbi:hypothetical protein N7U66_02900 [Lacinutrix neustonica]|uniref:Uncharacterized protein n=1 Tax=Lacinutrix neustonica TaxID=2980107 RepID=A0A9E8MXE9_9FLAO|nr:hypothetical protein [Lacinutrix neustonica]WAC02649.1 hypothetical protein N7U66_02900 [Lacinutrix neustonica]